MTSAIKKAAPTREQSMQIKPVRLDPVYEDPDTLLEWFKESSPHKNIFDLEGYIPPEGSYPFFRTNIYTVKGGLADERLHKYLHNPIFIEAAKKAYNVEIVRPIRLVANFNPPSPAIPGHFDFPQFRGMVTQPDWHATIMGRSQLFRNWELQIASGLAWFYRGEGGNFLYWPNGNDQPVEVERSPFWNQGLIADNEYTYHQPGRTGTPEKYFGFEHAGPKCKLEWKDERWHITKEGETVITYSVDEVRMMTLWKAYVFKDEKEAEVFDQHADDMDITTATQMFAEDIRSRGIEVEVPSDPLNDEDWKKVLFDVYREKDVPADIEPIV